MSLTLSLLVGFLSLGVAPEEVDLLVRGATVYDGSGIKGRVVDVAIKGDKIVAIGKLVGQPAQRVINAEGLILAPGFIDLHSHSDRSIVKKPTNQNLNYLMQGVTSVLTGNCGSGPVDVADYLKKIEKLGAGTNVLHLLPQGSLRRKVLATANRPPSPAELATMQKLTTQAMQDGAWGISTGLIYVPSSFAKSDELIALAKTVAKFGGLYATHMRGEGTGLLSSVEEAIGIGQQAKLPVHISHFKASGLDAWGLAGEAIRLVDNARRKGQVVTADQYPYTASSTSLAAMVIPSRYRAKEQLTRALADPKQREAVRQAIMKGINRRGNGERLFVAGFRPERKWQGKNIAELAKQEGLSPVDLVLNMQKQGGASMINFGMSPEEVRLIMRQPFVATASDGSARAINEESQPHPRSYGCFPRKIGRYALKEKVLSLPQAIRSCSGLPADILKLPFRGYIRVKYFADVVLLDPKSFIDTATFEKPHQHATGVRYLIVNGQLAIDNGKFTGKLAGQPLRHGN